jgi:hypothetical protein
VQRSARVRSMHGRFERYSATETGQSVARLEGLARLMDGAPLSCPAPISG